MAPLSRNGRRLTVGTTATDPATFAIAVALSRQGKYNQALSQQTVEKSPSGSTEA